MPAGGSASVPAPRAPRRRPPRALWHPVPLTELGFVFGGIAVVVGVMRGGIDDGAVAIGFGLLLITVAAIELCAREHLCGYRSHVVLLSFLAVVAVHTVVVAADGSLNGPGLLVTDGLVFGGLAWWLRRAFGVLR